MFSLVRRWMFALLLPSLVPVAVAQQPGKPRVVPDLAYVADGSERQRLDLYLPATVAPGGAARPLVVWIHGGGWEAGNRHNCPARPLAEHGYIVASLGYRLSQQAVFPAQIEDVKAAVRFLRAHAGEYGIDPARVGAWGESAGGHLVALLGTTGHDRRFDVGANLDQSSAVQCVIDWYGPTDFLHWGEPPANAVLDTPGTAVAHLLGGTVSTHRHEAETASPVDFVNKDSAPFLILHGDHDSLVPVQQSQELDAALRAAGVESTLIVLPGAGHGGKAFGTPENILRMAEFFDRHLGGLVATPAPAKP